MNNYLLIEDLKYIHIYTKTTNCPKFFNFGKSPTKQFYTIFDFHIFKITKFKVFL